MAPPPFPLDVRALDDFVTAALAEDVGTGDITAAATIPPGCRLRARAAARETMVLAGMPAALAVFRKLDPDVAFTAPREDGERVDAGGTLFEAVGDARALLTAERTALNILQHLSGIATLTRRFVDAVAGSGAVILDTRKTVPLLRRLAKYATACGGARNHRMGLFDAVMIKDNHIALAGSVEAAVRAARAAGHSRIEVECDTLDQVGQALAAGATSLLLDNMSCDELRRAVALVGGRVPLEASGGVTLDTVADIAATGVDFISVGRLTQSAPAIDIGLDFGGEG